MFDNPHADAPGPSEDIKALSGGRPVADVQKVQARRVQNRHP